MRLTNRCPRCSRDIDEFPSVSRRDGETIICSKCGISEALFDYEMNIQSRKKGENYINELKELEKTWLKKKEILTNSRF